MNKSQYLKLPEIIISVAVNIIGVVDVVIKVQPQKIMVQTQLQEIQLLSNKFKCHNVISGLILNTINIKNASQKY